MTNTQITLIQIDNYGPWTVTPEPRREVDLQTLQSRLYADLSQLFGAQNGYVFFSRFDNMIAITNGIDLETHELVQESIGNRYPVTVSLSVASNPAPIQALEFATNQLQAEGSAQDQRRQEIVEGDPLEESVRRHDDVQLAHFDINDVTSKYTDKLNEFETFINVEQSYAELMQYACTEYESLTFFVGGDNFIAICPSLKATEYRDIITHVREVVGTELKVGVGRAATACQAGIDAKHALEECRETGAAVQFHS